MYGEAGYAETAYAESTKPVVIVPPAPGEEGPLTNPMTIFAIEIDLVFPGSAPEPPPPPPPPVQLERFVSNAGSDSNDGLTSGTPWATVAKVNSATLEAGTNILFRRGDTFRGSGIFPQMGGLMYGSYGSGAKAIIHGSPNLMSTSLWTHAANGRWTTPVASDGPAPEMFFVNSLGSPQIDTVSSGLPQADTASLELAADGEWFWASGTLHVKSGADGSPANNPATKWTTIAINRLEYGIRSDTFNGVTVRNIEFRHFANPVQFNSDNNQLFGVEAHFGSRHSIEFGGANNWAEDCVSNDNGRFKAGQQGAHGYHFNSGAHDCTLKNCHATRNGEDCIQMQNNCGDRITIDGGDFTNPSENALDRKAGTGHIIRNALLENDVDHPTINLHVDAVATPGTFVIEDCRVEHNHTNCALDVISAMSCTSRRNVYDGGIAGSNQTVRIRGDISGGITTFDSSHDIIWGRGSNEALDVVRNVNVTIDHATVYGELGRGIEGTGDGFAGSGQRIKITNSIIRSGAGDEPWSPLTNGNYSGTNHCLLHRNDSGDPVYINYLTDTSGTVSSFPDYLKSQLTPNGGQHFSDRGILQNVITADPLFTNPTAGDFSLQAGSPARNAASDGTHLGAWQG